jgi:hypothetical protein
LTSATRTAPTLRETIKDTQESARQLLPQRLGPLNRKLEREAELIGINRQDLQHNQQHLLLLGQRAVTPGFMWMALASVFQEFCAATRTPGTVTRRDPNQERLALKNRQEKSLAYCTSTPLLPAVCSWRHHSRNSQRAR